MLVCAQWVEMRNQDFKIVDWLRCKFDDQRLEPMITTDCRSLYDVLYRGHGLTSCKRTAMEVLAVREIVREDRLEVRWVDTSVMLADPLTKEFTSDSKLSETLKGERYSIIDITSKAEEENRAVHNKVLWCVDF